MRDLLLVIVIAGVVSLTISSSIIATRVGRMEMRLNMLEKRMDQVSYVSMRSEKIVKEGAERFVAVENRAGMNERLLDDTLKRIVKLESKLYRLFPNYVEDKLEEIE